MHAIPIFPLEKLHSHILFSEQAKMGDDVSIISWNNENKFQRISLQKNLTLYFLRGWKIPFPPNVVNPCVFGLNSLLHKLDSDVVHAHQLFKLTALSSALACKKTKVPLVVTIHGVIATSGYLIESLQRNYYRSVGRLISKVTSRIICLTESDAEQMMRLGCSPDKLRIVPNGIDCEMFKPDDECLDNVIVYSGRFVQQKGLNHLIEAMKIVVKDLPDTKLVMTGNGPLFPMMHDLVNKSGLSNNVLFKGMVPLDELVRTINSSSVFVLPSLMEGMPRSLLEAMACGKPVVGSDIPGINDVVTSGENGVLVSPQDPIALAESLSLLLTDKNLRRKLGQNARQLMLEKFSLDIIYTRTKEIYYEAINDLN